MWVIDDEPCTHSQRTLTTLKKHQHPEPLTLDLVGGRPQQEKHGCDVSATLGDTQRHGVPEGCEAPESGGQFSRGPGALASLCVTALSVPEGGSITTRWLSARVVSSPPSAPLRLGGGHQVRRGAPKCKCVSTLGPK